MSGGWNRLERGPLRNVLPWLLMTFLLPVALPGAAADPVEIGPQAPGLHFQDAFNTGVLDEGRWEESYYAESSGRCGHVSPEGALVLQPIYSWSNNPFAQTVPLDVAEGSVVSFWTRMGRIDADAWIGDFPIANTSCGDRVDGWYYQEVINVQLWLVPQGYWDYGWYSNSCYYYGLCKYLAYEGDLRDLMEWDYVEVPVPDDLAHPGLRLQFVYGGAYSYVEGDDPAWVIDDLRVQSVVPASGGFNGGTPVPLVTQDQDGSVRVYDGRRQVVANQPAGDRGFAEVGSPSGYGVDLQGVYRDDGGSKHYVGLPGAWLPCDGNIDYEIPEVDGDEAAVYCRRDGNWQRDEHEEGFTTSDDGVVRFSDHFDGTDMGSTGSCGSVDQTRWSVVTGFVQNWYGCHLFLSSYNSAYAESQPILLDGTAKLRFDLLGYHYNTKGWTYSGVPFHIQYRVDAGPWQTLEWRHVHQFEWGGVEIDLPGRFDFQTVQIRLDNEDYGHCWEEEVRRYDYYWGYYYWETVTYCSSGLLLIDNVRVVEWGRGDEIEEHGIDVNGMDVRSAGDPGAIDGAVQRALVDGAEVTLYRDRNGNGQMDEQEQIAGLDSNEEITLPPVEPGTVPEVTPPGVVEEYDGHAWRFYLDMDGDGGGDVPLLTLYTLGLDGADATSIPLYRSEQCPEGTAFGGMWFLQYRALGGQEGDGVVASGCDPVIPIWQTDEETGETAVCQWRISDPYGCNEENTLITVPHFVRPMWCGSWLTGNEQDPVILGICDDRNLTLSGDSNDPLIIGITEDGRIITG